MTFFALLVDPVEPVPGPRLYSGGPDNVGGERDFSSDEPVLGVTMEGLSDVPGRLNMVFDVGVV
jgi:hypothetical protein